MGKDLPEIEKKKWFLAGIIEGEGSLCISIKNHNSSRFGFLIDPEFFIYQHKNRRELLEMAKEIFKTGSIWQKPGNENVLVYGIRDRRSLKERVIPFFEKYMIFSARKKDYYIFKKVIESLERKEHYTKEGFIKILELTYKMNQEGKGRKRELIELVKGILRDYTPDP